MQKGGRAVHWVCVGAVWEGAVQKGCSAGRGAVWGLKK